MAITPRALIFDIGGTVFDWHTALVDAQEEVVPENLRRGVDPAGFAYA
jgi:FMN phosphatase YigB (HAD superfamily)